MGNNEQGINFEIGSSNYIGPDNIIANNGEVVIKRIISRQIQDNMESEECCQWCVFLSFKSRRVC